MFVIIIAATVIFFIITTPITLQLLLLIFLITINFNVPAEFDQILIFRYHSTLVCNELHLHFGACKPIAALPQCLEILGNWLHQTMSLR